MKETKLKIEKNLDDGGTGIFCVRQYKSRYFIYKKINPVRRFEDINNDVSYLVPQGHTELFANSMKAFYILFLLFRNPCPDGMCIA